MQDLIQQLTKPQKTVDNYYFFWLNTKCVYWCIPTSPRGVKDKNAKNSDTQVLAENKHHAARVTFKVYLHFYINKHFTEVRLNLKRQGMVEHYMVWYTMLCIIQQQICFSFWHKTPAVFPETIQTKNVLQYLLYLLTSVVHLFFPLKAIFHSKFSISASN